MSHQKDCYWLGVISCSRDPSGDHVGPLVGVKEAILRHYVRVAGHATPQLQSWWQLLTQRKLTNRSRGSGYTAPRLKQYWDKAIIMFFAHIWVCNKQINHSMLLDYVFLRGVSMIQHNVRIPYLKIPYSFHQLILQTAGDFGPRPFRT